jgi:hypothetical protein
MPMSRRATICQQGSDSPMLPMRLCHISIPNAASSLGSPLALADSLPPSPHSNMAGLHTVYSVIRRVGRRPLAVSHLA